MTNAPDNLKTRIALVTGASRGIGRAIALRLAHGGAAVAINFRSGGRDAETVCEEIRQGGGEAELFAADVSDPAAAKSMVEAVQKRFGRVDILVNNAGVVRDNLMLSMDDDEWDAVLKTNLNGAFYCCRAAARFMIRQRYGRIINISSVAGSKPGRGQVNYAASKGAVNALTRALAAELASRNITVNAVAPGMVETEMSQAVRDAAADKILPLIALGRFAKPEDIAGVVAFLASPEADYITGEVIHVDGGLRG